MGVPVPHTEKQGLITGLLAISLLDGAELRLL